MYNNHISFSWATGKARINFKKHGVDFKEAVIVFYDPLARIFDDFGHSDIEERLIIMGYSVVNRLLFVAHTYLEESEEIRIISARKATYKEKQDFENQIK